MSETAVLELENVSHAFDRVRVIDEVSFTVAPGELLGLLGPSGSGKTTLLNIIAGLLRPTAGTVTISGQDIGALAPGALDVFRGRHIGIVFQTLHLVSALSVADNLHLARYLAGLRRDEARLHGILESLGIGAMAAARPRTLSQGEAQRVAIARAVINDPAIILADEPTSALDDGNAGQVLNLLSQQADRCGATLVIATHDRRIRDRFDAVLELGGPP